MLFILNKIFFVIWEKIHWIEVQSRGVDIFHVQIVSIKKMYKKSVIWYFSILFVIRLGLLSWKIIIDHSVLNPFTLWSKFSFTILKQISRSVILLINFQCSNPLTIIHPQLWLSHIHGSHPFIIDKFCLRYGKGMKWQVEASNFYYYR